MKAFENGEDDKVGGLISYRSSSTKHLTRLIEWDSDFTLKLLYRMGFTWPITGDTYIKGTIWSVRTLGFFD